MLELAIDAELQPAAPALTVGCLTAQVTVTPHDEALWQALEAIAARYAALSMDQARALAPVKALRDAYRALGNDPTRYRGSNEALLRRIVHGKGLYRVNTAVDVNNLLSLETLCSCGVVDLARVEPPVMFRPGRADEAYAGIGRGAIKLARIPVFVDAQGPFASTTSDSERSRVTLDTRHMALFIISYGGPDLLPQALARASDLFQRYAAAQAVETAQFAY
jgi:DNA/RNA-binding domain of Phe-tRNA-synthetase-like protein